MMQPRSERSSTAEREIMVSRVIEGPRRAVFEAYTEARRLERWWGPNGFSVTTNSFAFREGGVWDFVMHGPDGTNYSNWICWREIAPPERLVLEHGASADDPDSFESTITFTERASGTEVTMRSVFRTKEQRDLVVEQYGAIEGGQQTLGRLASYLAGAERNGGRS